MNQSEMLQNIIEAYTVKRDELVEKCINDAISAFDAVIKKIDEDLFIKVKRLNQYNRWLVLLGSRLLKSSDMSIAAIEQDDTKLNVKINIFEPNGIDNNILSIDSRDPQHLANILGFIYKSNEFQGKLKIYHELSAKGSFEATIFATELHRYTPSDLYLSVKRNWLKSHIDSADEIEMNPDDYIAVHRPYGFSDYVGKYGLVNGSIFEVTRATELGLLKIKFIA